MGEPRWTVSERGTWPIAHMGSQYLVAARKDNFGVPAVSV